MNIIHKIEIRYFRSIHHVRLNDLPDVVVLAGRNDAGKSNILKALNLFFNNQTDWGNDISFSEDFSRTRLREVRKETIKGRQFIKIAITFNRGNHFEGSLPERFLVTRTWYRDNITPTQTDDLTSRFNQGLVPTASINIARASLQRYLNRLKFQYIPAIKDQQYFAYLLSLLQDVILSRRPGEQDIEVTIEEFNAAIAAEANELHNEFERVTSIPTYIGLPSLLADLFKAFTVTTESGEEKLPLNYRGDGIRSRFLPSLLYYISTHSNYEYIWGFEEPENSMEQIFATELAKAISETYCTNAQVFITTHSPAFFGVQHHNAAICRVYKEEEKTSVCWIRGPSRQHNLQPTSIIDLEGEIGLMEFQERYQKEYEEKKVLLEEEKRALAQMREEIRRQEGPILLTEGKWDVAILAEAWSRQRGQEDCPFRTKECGVSEEGGTTGGAGLLRQALETVRLDEPITVGLFDRDKEGVEKGFNKLSANFRQIDGDEDIRIHRQGTSGAVVLPVIPGREEYAVAMNMPLEYYFDDEYLEVKVDGDGLELYFPEIEHIIKTLGIRLDRTECTVPHLRQIRNESKKAFVEKVVPRLPDEAFNNFDQLFLKIETAIRIIGERRDY